MRGYFEFDFFARDPRLLSVLQQIDVELADTVQARGCKCGGALHVANYLRKLAGLLVVAGVTHAVRFSFCCASCRKRTTPPSVRFFGRRRFPSMMFLLLSAISGRSRHHRGLLKLYDTLDVSQRSVYRWRRWWREEFSRSRFWQHAKSRLVPPAPSRDELPLGLLARFAAHVDDFMARVLRFLCPLTTSSCAHVS